MRASPEEKYEALYLLDPHAPRPMTAGEVKEKLGLVQDERTIQRWACKAYGRIPTRREIASDADRRAKVRALEAEGLDERYCSVRQHITFWPCLIRDVDGCSLFVCRKHSRRGDH